MPSTQVPPASVLKHLLEFNVAALVRFIVQAQHHQLHLALQKLQVETLFYGNEDFFSCWIIV